MPGRETRLYLIEYPPAADGSGHFHPVEGLGYIINGAIISAFGDDEPQLFQKGDSFIDPANKLHSTTRNASETEPLSFLIAYTVKQGEPVTVCP